MKRVVITGYGINTSLGHNAKANWDKLRNGLNSVSVLEGEKCAKLPARIGALLEFKNNKVTFEKLLSKSDIKTMSKSTATMICTSDEAIKMANWSPSSDSERENAGISIGSGSTNDLDIIASHEAMRAKGGYAGMSPYVLLQSLGNMTAGHLSIRYALRGPHISVNTACAAGLQAIGEAFRLVQSGRATMMLAGGSDVSLGPWNMAAFCRIRALTTKFNEQPHKASRPFDAHRSGFVMGEGAAALILEEYHAAKRRGANILGEILGYSCLGEAHNLVAPNENANGAYRCMKSALEDAQLDPSQIGYVNAHATSTPVGDVIECKAISRLFNCRSSDGALPYVSSLKGNFGHCMTAAGAVEAVGTLMCMMQRKIPPSLNLDELDPEIVESGVRIVPQRAENVAENAGCVDFPNANATQCDRLLALTNAFGFGGVNSSLVLSVPSNSVSNS